MNFSENVLALNPSDKPMIECDFYHWLKYSGKSNFHVIHDKLEYLVERFGFIKGKDTIDQNVTRDLRYIGSHYFDKECKRGKL